MRTSFNKSRKIDQFLLRQMSSDQRKDFEVEMLISSDLYDRVQQQKAVHAIVKDYGRKQLRQEIAAVDHRIFESNRRGPFQKFRTAIKSLF